MLRFVWLSLAVLFLASLADGARVAARGLADGIAPLHFQDQGFFAPSPAPRLNAHERAGWLAPEVKRPGLVFVSDITNGGVDVFRDTPDPQQVGFIGRGIRTPYGIFVSPSKNLYVCDFDRRVVTVFPPGHLRPSLTYRAGLLSPLFVTVDAAENVYVANRGILMNGALVTEFGPGSTNPKAFFITPGVEADGLAVDANGNLDVSYRFKDGNGGIVQFAPGSRKGADLGIKIDQPQGLAVDANDDIVAVDTGQRVIDVFPPGATQPSQQISGVPVPNSIVFDPVTKQLLVSNQGGRGTVAVYALAYPNGAPRPRIPNQFGALVGVAFSAGRIP